jgi:dipeptidyl aminopeptidase/acylaminoacyl peptidase
MADVQLEAALINWEPRFTANGVDVNDYHRVAGSVKTWAEWLPAWVAHGDRLAEDAADAEAQHRYETAGELWRRAATSYHFGKFVWMIDLELHAAAARKASAALGHALRLLDPAAERLEIPFDGAKMIAIYRRPSAANGSPLPLVVIIPGLDSTKEEFFETEQIFLRRGLATLTLEGPGQGETGFSLPIRPDFETPFGVALDFIEGISGIDHTRIGVVGFSLGGYYAPRVAAFEPRVKAAVGISGPYDLSEYWDQRPQVTRETFQHLSGAVDERDAKAKAAQLSLSGVAELIEQPLLIITGDKDRLVPWQETKRIADEAQNATWRLYEGGNHVVNNMPYQHKAFAADWLREQLTA